MSEQHQGGASSKDTAPNDIFTSLQMEGVEPIVQCKRAIRHTLERIRENRDVGWHCGLGTQTFSLLTEAAATLWERPLDEVRNSFAPKFPENYQPDSEVLSELRTALRRIWPDVGPLVHDQWAIKKINAVLEVRS